MQIDYRQFDGSWAPVTHISPMVERYTREAVYIFGKSPSIEAIYFLDQLRFTR